VVVIDYMGANFSITSDNKGALTCLAAAIYKSINVKYFFLTCSQIKLGCNFQALAVLGHISFINI
jgi:hypothetical protein